MNMSRWLKKRMGVLFLLCSATAMFLAGAAQAGPKEDRLALQLKKLQHAEAKLEREIRQLRRGPAGGGKMMDLAVPQQNDVKELLRLADRRATDQAAELNPQQKRNLLAEKSKELNRVKAARKKLEGAGKQAAPVSGSRRAARVEDGPGSISGRITDAAGVGLAGSAYVYSVDDEWDYYAYALTDADGNYTVSDLPAGSYKVEFDADDEIHVSEWFNNKTNFDAADAVAVTSGGTVSGINAELEVSGSISGKMTDALGKGIVGSVHVYDLNYNWAGYAEVAADGSYTVSGLRAGSWKVKFEADDVTYAQEWYNDKANFADADAVAVTSGATVSGIDAELEVSGSISGKMTDVQGSGIAGWVYVYDLNYEWVDSASAAVDGSYTVSGLRAGSYKVEFEAENEYFISQWYKGSSTFACADEVAVTAGGTTASINAALAAGGAVSGKMTDAAGAGISGYVQVYDLDQNWAGYAWSEEDGSYTVSGLPAGSYKVEFSPDDGEHLGQWYNGKASFAAADAVAVNVSKTTPDINATLAQGGSISGTMTDAAENGLAGEVTVYDENHGWVNSIWTDDGSYTVSGLATGRYKVEFNADGNYASEWHNNKASFDAADAVAVTSGATVSGINAALEVGGSISGKVTNAAKESISNITVQVYNSSRQAVESGFTDSEGNYTVAGLPAGSYKVYFSDYSGKYAWQWHNGKLSFTAADAVAVTAPNATANANASLVLGGGISGKMVNPDGQGVQGFVCAYHESGTISVNLCSWVGSAGSYAVKGLATGQYKVMFMPYGSDGWLTCGSSKPYVTEWYNNKRSFNAADPVLVTAPSVTTGIDAEVSTEPLKGKALLPILNLVL